MNPKQLASIHERALASPQWFFHEVLGEPYFYPKQQEMALAVRDGVDRISVCGCNSSGKDFTAGRLILYWLGTRYPSKVLVFGPSTRQIQDIVFNETRAAFPRFQEMFGMSMPQVAPRVNHNDKHFSMGFSTDRDLKLTGFHSPNLLVMITEAHGVEQAHIEKIFTLKPKCWILTGNPFSNSGLFFDSFHGHKEGWYPITISAYDTPNVIEGKEVIPGLIDAKYIEDAKFMYGEDSAMYQASVLGIFPGTIPGTIVPLDVAMAAQFRPKIFEGPVICGLDVAGEGDLADNSVLCRRQGMGVEFVWKLHGEKITEVERRAKHYLNEHPEIDWFVVDGVGLGAGVVDYLQESRHARKVIDFRGGARAVDPRFQNASTEAYWHMRLAYMHMGLAVPEDRNLMGQVSSRKYREEREKVIALESKRFLISRGKPSPDEADALAMTFAVFSISVDDEISMAYGINRYGGVI